MMKNANFSKIKTENHLAGLRYHAELRFSECFSYKEHETFSFYLNICIGDNGKV